MALKKQRIVSLNAESVIGDTRVVRLSSTVTSDEKVNTSYSETILNNDLYKANREEVRSDILAFRDAVYQLEDEMIALDKLEQEDAPADPVDEPVEEDAPVEPEAGE